MWMARLAASLHYRGFVHGHEYISGYSRAGAGLLLAAPLETCAACPDSREG